MRFLSATLGTLCFTASLAAQTPTFAKQNCPVSLIVSRWAVGETRNALAQALRPGQDLPTPTHGLYLRTFKEEALPTVLQVTAVVHGSNFSAFSAHVQNVRSTPGAPSSDRTQTFHLASDLRDIAGNWKLTVDHLPMVREVDVTEIQFANGTTWHESADAHCRIQPSPFLLVAGTH